MAEPTPTTHPRVMLSEQHAWDIATTVSTPIRGHVQLALAEAPDHFNGGMFEWLEICVPPVHSFSHPAIRRSLAWVDQAREACVVWYLLSCCHGFGGNENDAFWKRLIDEMAHDATRATTYTSGSATAPSDRYEFFPSWCVPSAFPRFRLVLPTSNWFEESEEEEEEDDNDIFGFGMLARLYDGDDDVGSGDAEETDSNEEGVESGEDDLEDSDPNDGDDGEEADDDDLDEDDDEAVDEEMEEDDEEHISEEEEEESDEECDSGADWVYSIL